MNKIHIQILFHKKKNKKNPPPSTQASDSLYVLTTYDEI